MNGTEVKGDTNHSFMHPGGMLRPVGNAGKRIWGRAVFLTLLAFVWALPQYAHDQFASGTGTPSDPYIITTAAAVDDVRNYLSAHFRLAGNIDLTQFIGDYSPIEGWVYIGTVNALFPDADSFNGSFNGAGHKITGLWANRSGSLTVNPVSYRGLFGVVYGARIDSVGVEIDNSAGHAIHGNVAVGGLVGQANNALINACYVTGYITVRSITPGKGGGGLVGENINSTITNSYFAGTVDGTGDSNKGVGGLVGQHTHSTLENCYAVATISGTGSVSSNYRGGLAGESTHSNITNGYAAGDIFSGVRGVLVGTRSAGNFTDCCYDNTIAGQTRYDMTPSPVVRGRGRG